MRDARHDRGGGGARSVAALPAAKRFGLVVCCVGAALLLKGGLAAVGLDAGGDSHLGVMLRHKLAAGWRDLRGGSHDDGAAGVGGADFHVQLYVARARARRGPPPPARLQSAPAAVPATCDPRPATFDPRPATFDPRRPTRSSGA